jgi:uncharacterized protein YaeQ
MSPEASLALKSTIYKAQLQIADMDRGVYAEHSLTLALHPSETEERLLIRLLAFALHVPQDDHRGMLEPARGLADADQPDLWQHDLSGQLVQWIELGQPDERRLAKACGRAEQVVVYSYSAATPIWWAAIANKVTRLTNLSVWQIPADEAKALAALAKRGMQWQVTVQDGTVWVNDGGESLEITPQALMRPRR